MPAFDEAEAPYSEAKVIGHIESAEIDESSGLAASLCQDNVIWTHNDSGDGPFIYAMSPTGKNLGVWRVAGAESTDWEDIAIRRTPAGECYLYIGETGNTDKLSRPQHTIYKVREPVVGPDQTNMSKKEPAETAASESLTFRYPDGNHDSETLIVNPADEAIYVLTKSRSEPSGVYKIAPQFGQTTTAQKIAEIKVPTIPFGMLTGGEASPDGKRVILCDYAAAYELTLPANTKDLDAIWTQKPVPIRLGERKQGEAITYSPDGKMIYATSEGKNSPVIALNRK